MNVKIEEQHVAQVGRELCSNWFSMYGPARVINRSCSEEGRLTSFHSYHGNLCGTVAIFFPVISAPYLNSSNERQRASQKYLTFSQTTT